MARQRPRYLIDTNIWSALVRRSSPEVVQRFLALTPEQLVLSPIVLGELALDGGTSVAYAQIRSALEAAGTPIGPNDTWIAAQALHHQLVLVTDNTREFARVPGLLLENWITSHAD